MGEQVVEFAPDGAYLGLGKRLRLADEELVDEFADVDGRPLPGPPEELEDELAPGVPEHERLVVARLLREGLIHLVRHGETVVIFHGSLDGRWLDKRIVCFDGLVSREYWEGRSYV